MPDKTELTMPAVRFDTLMRKALGVAAPTKAKAQPPERKPRKATRPKKP